MSGSFESGRREAGRAQAGRPEPAKAAPPPPQERGRPSYRPEQRSRSGGSDLSRFVILLGTVGGLAAILVVGYLSTRPVVQGIPLVEAPAGPVRVKPLVPGGLQVMGAEDAEDGTEHLAPAAEVPAFSVLRAARPKPRPPVVVQAAAPASVAVAPPAPIQRAAAMMVEPADPAPTPAVSQAKAEESVMAQQGMAVQLAAFQSPQAAQEQWGALTSTMPHLFSGHQPELLRASVAGRQIWRLRTAGFASIADAASFCADVRAHGDNCSIAAF